MGWSHGTGLRNMGLLNVDAPDLSELQTSYVRPSAYCTSNTCCRYVDEKGKFRVYPRILKMTDQLSCPDCGFAIVWRRE